MKHSQIITFMSAKGGVGQTFISSNFAHIKAKKVKTLFLQLSNYPDIDSALDLNGKTHILHLIEFLMNDEEPTKALEKILRKKEELYIILTPSKSSLLKNISPDHIERLLNLFKNYFEFIIVDLSNDFNATSQVLNASNKLYTLTTLDPNSIHKLHTFLNEYASKDPEVLLNQLPEGISQKEAKKYINHELKVTIPQVIDEAWLTTIESTFLPEKSSIYKALSKFELKHS